MTIRISLFGGLLTSLAGGTLGGIAALIQGTGDVVWLYAAIGSAIVSTLGWLSARRRASSESGL